MSRAYDNTNNNRGPRTYNNDGNRGGHSRGVENRGEFIRVNNNNNNNTRADVTVDALVAFARSILNERQLGDLSERLQSRRPQSREQQPARTPYEDTRRGRGGRGGFGGRGGHADEGRVPAFEGRGGRGGRAPRGGLNDQREPRPASAPSTQQPREPRRRNNRRPNADA